MNLNLGSGHVHMGEDWVNLDVNPATGCNVAAWIPQFPFKDEAFDHILASHVIEHIPDTIAVFNECWRVLIPGGTMEVLVPYAFNPAAFQDPTHVRYFVPESGMYYTQGMAYLLYGIKIWTNSDWHLQDNGWVVRGYMVK